MTTKASSLELRPAPRTPPLDGAVPFSIRPGWHRASGNASAQLKPLDPKSVSATALTLRKLRIDKAREIAQRLTDSITRGFAAMGWKVPA